MPSSILDRIGRSSCTHADLKHRQRCEICDVIVYENEADFLKDASFDEMLIAFPKSRPPMSEADLTRMRAENQQIRQDAKTKYVFQKTFIATHAVKSATSCADPRIVQYRENTMASRDELFPKIPIVPRMSTAHANPPNRQSVDTSTDIVVLGDLDSASHTRMRIYLPPFHGEFVTVDVDSTITVAVLIDYLTSSQGMVSKGWSLRWVEDEDDPSPDLDLPAIDSYQIVCGLNTSTLCLYSQQ